KQGNVENARVVRGIGGGCDEEALRVVREAKFEPGMQRGHPVRVQYSLNINFRL
ncbi:energy transducer TonB, partial [Gracilimonas sp.]|uniref:energy transducer TonB n=1 Tax=Gracilimonas sp. TaxID=1974203 RepID=UPI0028720618|nr:energy transducer TonB [Gracilimonas sp.]